MHFFYRIFNQNGQSVKQKRHFYALIEGPKMNNFGWCALKMHTRNCLSFKQSSFFQFMKLDFIAWYLQYIIIILEQKREIKK